MVYNPEFRHRVNFDLSSATFYPSSFHLLSLAVLGEGVVVGGYGGREGGGGGGGEGGTGGSNDNDHHKAMIRRRMVVEVVPALLRLHKQYARVPVCHKRPSFQNEAVAEEEMPSLDGCEGGGGGDGARNRDGGAGGDGKEESLENCLQRLYRWVSKRGADEGHVFASLYAWYHAHRPRSHSRRPRSHSGNGKTCTHVTYSRHQNLDSIRRLHNSTCLSIAMKGQRRARVDFAGAYSSTRDLCTVERGGINGGGAKEAEGKDNGGENQGGGNQGGGNPEGYDASPLLIVVFNVQSHVAVSLPYFEILYAPLYRDLLYCVPQQLDPQFVSSYVCTQ